MLVRKKEMTKCGWCKAETANKKFCSLSCSAKAQPRIKKIYYIVCLECGKTSTVCSKKKKRKFCNQSCSALYINKKRRRKVKFCLNCNEAIPLQNKYCNAKCNNEYSKEKYIQEWLNEKNSGTTKRSGLSRIIRNYLIECSNYSCSICSWGETNESTNRVPLEVDHIDGNHKNNSYENLRVLCPNCHSLTPTYRALNRGNGRKDR